MKDKTITKVFKYIILVLFMMYFAIFVMVNLGYYEYASYKKKVFTEEQIARYEEDIKNNVDIDIEDYLVDEEDFQDRPKRIGLRISEFISKSCKQSVSGIFKFLNDVLEE
jgi:Na+(H+)/acetate symporter ActP